MTRTIVHLSDLHFGVHCDLAQMEALAEFLPGLAADAVVVSGDLSQRARHGEFQAAHMFLRRIAAAGPVLTIPGNHDVQWWESPFHLLGTRRLYAKYRRWFGEDLAPVLRVPGLVVAGLLTSHGVAAGSMTWNLNDMAVKGHLPASEVDRVARVFAEAPADAVKVAVLHHNVLPGQLSRRHGLARPEAARRRLVALGADVVLTGHDHQEAAAQVDGRLAVSAAGTHSSRMRGGRPSVFNLVRIDAERVAVQHMRWDAASRRFLQGDVHQFARGRADRAVVSVAGSGSATS